MSNEKELLLVTVEDLEARYEARRAEREANKAEGGDPTGKKVSKFLNPLIIEKDTEYAVKILHGYSASIDLKVHQFKGNTPANNLCEQHFGKEHCSICAMTATSKNGKTFKCSAKTMKCLVGYCFDLIGKERDVKGSDGTTRTFLVNPIVILQLPKGGDSGVDTTLKMMDKAKMLDQMVFIITKSVPPGEEYYRIQLKEAMTEEEYLKKVGSQVSMDLPPEALKVKGLSDREVKSLIIRSFRDVDFDALEKGGVILPEVELYPKTSKAPKAENTKSELESD